MTSIKFALSMIKLGKNIELSAHIKVDDVFLTDIQGDPLKIAPLHILALSRYYGGIPLLKPPADLNKKTTLRQHAPWSIECVNEDVHISIPKGSLPNLMKRTDTKDIKFKVSQSEWQHELMKVQRLLLKQFETNKDVCHLYLFQCPDKIQSTIELTTLVSEHVEKLALYDESLKNKEFEEPTYLSKSFLGKLSNNHVAEFSL